MKKSQKSLKKWTNEDWGYVTKKDEKNLNQKEVDIYQKEFEIR